MKLADNGEVSNGERPGSAEAQAEGGNSPGLCIRCGDAPALNVRAGDAFILNDDMADGEGPGAPSPDDTAILLCETVVDVGVTLALLLLFAAIPGVDGLLPDPGPSVAEPEELNLSGFCLF